MKVIASAPGKLILTGEYAVLAGAPAVVIAIDRRAIARDTGAHAGGSSPFLRAIVDELRKRRTDDDPAVQRALGITVDSSAFYDGMQKLGLGSSAAVTAAATALALGGGDQTVLRDEVLAVAIAAHAAAQATRGAAGSGADVAAAVHGGTIVYTQQRVTPRRWPASVVLVPFFTGGSADTATLVARVMEARQARATDVDAALAAVEQASRAAASAIAAPPDLAQRGVIGAFQLAAAAIDQLAAATGIALVPDCVREARTAIERLGGTAKTTGAGGGDIGIAVIPDTADVSEATRLLVEAGCQPLRLNVDERGVDLRPDAQ